MISILGSGRKLGSFFYFRENVSLSMDVSITRLTFVCFNLIVSLLNIREIFIGLIKPVSINVVNKQICPQA